MRNKPPKDTTPRPPDNRFYETWWASIPLGTPVSLSSTPVSLLSPRARTSLSILLCVYLSTSQRVSFIMSRKLTPPKAFGGQFFHAQKTDPQTRLGVSFSMPVCIYAMSIGRAD